MCGVSLRSYRHDATADTRHEQGHSSGQIFKLAYNVQHVFIWMRIDAMNTVMSSNPLDLFLVQNLFARS